MIPHTQTIVADPARGDGNDADGRPGDCWKTCIASLLDVPLDEVPHFLELEGEDGWWVGTQMFIKKHLGQDTELRWWLSLEEVPKDIKVPGYLIAAGDSPRGDFQHAVIASVAGDTVHDPHPSRAGLKGIPNEWYAVVAVQ